MIALLICFWLLIGTAVYVFGRKVASVFYASLVICWIIWPFISIVYFSQWIEEILDEYFK